jgi:hypothetical protein
MTRNFEKPVSEISRIHEFSRPDWDRRMNHNMPVISHLNEYQSTWHGIRKRKGKPHGTDPLRRTATHNQAKP